MLFLVGLLLFTGLAGAAWVITQIPMPSEAPLAYTTVIYDAEGNSLAELHGTENRFPLTIAEMPEVLQQAVIAAEDRNFLTHRGVDPMSLLRATWSDIRNKSLVQGGSTITQQYVKNQFVGSDRTLIRKLREAVVAVKLERKFDKRAILERYLNTVYFGRGAYGVQAAAQSYFGKDAATLDLKESAYLAGLIRTPSTGDVYSDPESAYFLRSAVLRSMVETGFITAGQAAETEAIPIESYVFVPAPPDIVYTNPGKDGIEYFVEYVKRELFEVYGEERVLAGGLRVHTTLNPRFQELAYEAVYGTLDRQGDPDGALVALDREGRVVAMVGGRQWSESQVNLAAATRTGGTGRQAGSAFKPFVLTEALRQGWRLSDTMLGPAKAVYPKVNAGKDWEVANYEDAAFGRLTLREATAYSVNTVYASLVLEVGAANVSRLARDLGIESEVKPVPAIALGATEVSVLELTNAYLTIANDGTRLEPRVIRTVRDGGSVLVDDRPRGGTRVLDPAVAGEVRSALNEVVVRGTGTQAQIPGGAWGKTGTTDEYGDAWFVGANDQLTVGVWIGYKEGQSRKLLNVHGVPRVAGGTFPAAMFRKFMAQAAPGDPSVKVASAIDPRSFPSQTPTTAAPATTTVATTVPASTTTTAGPTASTTRPATTEPTSVSTTSLPSQNTLPPATTTTTVETTTTSSSPPRTFPCISTPTRPCVGVP